MKANPLAACLVIARDLGMGCEVRTCSALTPPGSSAALQLCSSAAVSQRAPWSRTERPRQMRSARSPCPGLLLCAQVASPANKLCLRHATDFTQVASPAELEHALRLGFVPHRIVLDSPAKTRRDLRRALAAGVRLDAYSPSP